MCYYLITYYFIFVRTKVRTKITNEGTYEDNEGTFEGTKVSFCLKTMAAGLESGTWGPRHCSNGEAGGASLPRVITHHF